MLKRQYLSLLTVKVFISFSWFLGHRTRIITYNEVAIVLLVIMRERQQKK